MFQRPFHRRQFLHFSGAALVAPLLAACNQDDKPTQIFKWQGQAFGAPASIQIALHKKLIQGTTQQEMKRCAALMKQVEALIAQGSDSFSLYDQNSEINRLNRDGMLSNPSIHMLAVLDLSRRVYAQTNGAFDISVQPLWQAAQTIEQGAYSADQMDVIWNTAQARTGFEHIQITPQRIKFTKPNMAITLNGIAQGYITDQVCELLESQGLTNTLVNIGEFRASGFKDLTHPDHAQRFWSVGLQNPFNPIELWGEPIKLTKGLATSSSRGGLFGSRLSHIFNAKSGRKQNQKPLFISASVIHPSAAIADGLATAFTIMDREQIQKALDQNHPARAILIGSDKTTVILTSRLKN